MNESVPYIPRKFRENPFPGESSSQSERRKRLEKTKLELEIERLEEDFARRNSIIDECEVNIKLLISKCDSVQVRQGLLDKWIRDTQKRKKEADENWEDQRSFFERKDSDAPWRTVGRTTITRNHSNSFNNNRQNYDQQRNNNFNDNRRNYNNYKHSNFNSQRLKPMEETTVEPKILNLSNYSLTPNEISLLSYGLKFCPTPNKYNIDQSKIDISNFCR